MYIYSLYESQGATEKHLILADWDVINLLIIITVLMVLWLQLCISECRKWEIKTKLLQNSSFVELVTVECVFYLCRVRWQLGDKVSTSRIRVGVC